MNYFSYVQKGNWYPPMYRYDYRQYEPVTAYTVDRPVYVNNQNINVSPYQALNYQPEGVQYPYVYVPIAQFSKVGAKVKWDEQTQTLSVTTDYFQMRDELAKCKQLLEDYKTALETQMAEHPPENPLNKPIALDDIVRPYIIRPEMGYSVWTEKEETENKFGTIHIDHMQPGTIYDEPGAAVTNMDALIEELTAAYGYPVRLDVGGRHFTRLGVYKS